MAFWASFLPVHIGDVIVIHGDGGQLVAALERVLLHRVQLVAAEHDGPEGPGDRRQGKRGHGRQAVVGDSKDLETKNGGF